MASTLERVKKIVADNVSIDPNDVFEDSHIENDLGADSLDIVEIVMAVEEEFDIEITDEEMESAKTVSDLVDLVNRNV